MGTRGAPDTVAPGLLRGSIKGSIKGVQLDIYNIIERDGDSGCA